MPVLARPTQPRTNDVARITVWGEDISVLYPRRDDDLIQVVAGLGFCWDGRAWCLDMDGHTGTRSARVAEAGRALLAAGFPVEFPDEETRDAALTGTFTPEQRRWIRPAAGRFPGWLAITWPGWDETLYQAASSLPTPGPPSPTKPPPASPSTRASSRASIASRRASRPATSRASRAGHSSHTAPNLNNS